MIAIIEIGKTKDQALSELINKYAKRLKRFTPLDHLLVKEARLPKSATSAECKRQEAVNLQKVIREGDWVILLDEKGRGLNSREFANYLEIQQQKSFRRIVFVIGGAFGFDPEIYRRANDKISLSNMTFSHQLIRLLFMEQLYRAFTIINNHPYHND